VCLNLHADGSKAGNGAGSKFFVSVGGCVIVTVGAGRRVGGMDAFVGTGESIAPGSGISVGGFVVVQALIRIGSKINMDVNLWFIGTIIS